MTVTQIVAQLVICRVVHPAYYESMTGSVSVPKTMSIWPGP